MTKPSYFDTEIEERWWIRHPWGAFWLFVAVVAIIIPLGVWGINILTSDVQGKGETIVRENSADNRIASQAFFEDTYNGIMRFDLQLNDAAQALEQWKQTNPVPDGSSPVKLELYQQELNNKQTTMTGIQQQCRNAVAAYDAEAQKTIRAKWRSDDLPYQIESGNPATDCEADAAA